MAQPAVRFASELRNIHTAAGLTQEELAEAAGLTSRTVSDLERGVAFRHVEHAVAAPGRVPRSSTRRRAANGQPVRPPLIQPGPPAAPRTTILLPPASTCSSVCSAGTGCPPER